MAFFAFTKVVNLIELLKPGNFNNNDLVKLNLTGEVWHFQKQKSGK
jgi:hypothetical protein